MALGICLFSVALLFLPGQQTDSTPIVQPGAPGLSSKPISSADAGLKSRPPSAADIAFMQGMIMHHGQAVEMTELLRTRGRNKNVLELGKRISISQTDEMKYMKQWLQDRGLPISSGGMDHMQHMDHMKMGGMSGMDMSSMPMMPGMLTAAQMATLKRAAGARFDHLFLTGMIQHHTGALIMVQELFNTAGAGQDNVLFDFATDVDNTQQAEINIMKGLLKEKL